MNEQTPTFTGQVTGGAITPFTGAPHRHPGDDRAILSVQAKRFENWCADNGFKTALRDDPASPDRYMAYETEQRWLVWQSATCDTLKHCAGYFDVLDETFPMTPVQVAASIRRMNYRTGTPHKERTT